MTISPPAVLGILRSSVSRGRFGGLRGAEELLHQDGLRVIANADIPGQDRLALHEGWLPVLVHRDIRYRGQALALVLADDETRLQEALEGLQADEQPKIPLEDLHQSMSGTVRLFGQDNVFIERRVGRGSPEALRREDLRWQENQYFTGLQDPFEAELPAFVAQRDGEGLLLRGAFLDPRRVAGHVASVLGISRRLVRVESERPRSRIATDDAAILLPAAQVALAAWLDDRPVQLKLTRAETLAHQPKRPAAEIRVALAHDERGRIRGMEVDALFDGGAFPLGAGALADEAVLALQSAYRIEHLAGSVRVVATSSLPHGGVRGTATTALVFAIERSLDEMAAHLDLSPAEVRRRNLARSGDLGPDGRRWQFGEDPARVLARAQRSDRAGEGLACCLWPKRDQARSLRRLRLRVGLRGDELAHAQLALPETALEAPIFETLRESVAAHFGLEAKMVLVTGAGLVAEGKGEDPTALVDRLLVLLERAGEVATLADRLREAGATVWCDELPIRDRGAVDERAGELLVVSALVDVNELSFELNSRELAVTVGATRVTRDARRELGGAATVALGASWCEEVLVEYGRVANATAIYYQPPRLGDLPPISVTGAEALPSGEGGRSAGALRDPTEWWDWGAAPVAAALVSSIARRTGIHLKSLPLTPEALVEAAVGDFAS
jgi:CO/xanthine dehydrogenase Mo-binding subunit